MQENLEYTSLSCTDYQDTNCYAGPSITALFTMMNISVETSRGSQELTLTAVEGCESEEGAARMFSKMGATFAGSLPSIAVRVLQAEGLIEAKHQWL